MSSDWMKKMREGIKGWAQPAIHKRLGSLAVWLTRRLAQLGGSSSLTALGAAAISEQSQDVRQADDADQLV